MLQMRSGADDASLTEGLVGLLRRPITRATRRCAALHVLDWIGCAAAGARTPAGRVFAELATRMPEQFVRTIVGRRLAAADAALVDGALGSLLEMDDVHKRAILHPGPIVVPAVLALAAERESAGPRVLDAIVRGYEAMIRLGTCLGPGHYRQFHNTATCGPLGAAAACADLLALSDAATVHALGNAMTQAGGLWQCRNEPVMTKALHTARSARTGLESAVLAELGLTGPRFILEGPQGFFAGLAPEGRPERLLADPDAPWAIEATSLKPWPACRHVHATIDAALRLRAESHGRPIVRVEVRTYGDAIALCDRPEPRDPAEARFSLQHAAAAALLNGPPGLDAFEAAGLEDEAIAALRARVELVRDPRFDGRYPDHYGAALTIAFADGRPLEAEVEDAWGDPENPLAEADILLKAERLLGSAGASAAGSRRVAAAALALADGGPLAALHEAVASALGDRGAPGALSASRNTL